MRTIEKLGSLIVAGLAQGQGDIRYALSVIGTLMQAGHSNIDILFHWHTATPQEEIDQGKRCLKKLLKEKLNLTEQPTSLIRIALDSDAEKTHQDVLHLLINKKGTLSLSTRDTVKKIKRKILDRQAILVSCYCALAELSKFMGYAVTGSVNDPLFESENHIYLLETNFFLYPAQFSRHATEIARLAQTDGLDRTTYCDIFEAGIRNMRRMNFGIIPTVPGITLPTTNQSGIMTDRTPWITAQGSNSFTLMLGLAYMHQLHPKGFNLYYSGTIPAESFTIMFRDIITAYRIKKIITKRLSEKDFVKFLQNRRVDACIFKGDTGFWTSFISPHALLIPEVSRSTGYLAGSKPHKIISGQHPEIRGKKPLAQERNMHLHQVSLTLHSA